MFRPPNRPLARMAAVFALILLGLSMPGCHKALPAVAYDDLEWKDDLFYFQGALFTGTALKKHPNGQAAGEYPLTEGRLDGVVQEWWDNGARSVETHFENGKRHGSNRYWNKEGKLIKEQIYDHDKSISVKHY